MAGVLIGCTFGLAAPAQAAPKKVLVVTVTMGFRHSSIPTAEKVLAELAEESGAFTVDYARVEPNDPQFKGDDGKPDKAKVDAAIKAVLAEKMSPAALKKYDAVIFANTTGDLPLPDKQAFLDWIKSGKGFVGMHSATDTFHGFAGYLDMIGAEFKTHAAQVEVEPINQDHECPICKHLPARIGRCSMRFTRFKNFDPAKVHGLLTLDKQPDDKDPRREYTRSPGARNTARAACSTPRSAIARTCGTRTGRTARIPRRWPRPTRNISWAGSNGRWAWRR